MKKMGETSTISLDQGMVNGGFRMKDESHRLYMSSWYFSKEEIEKNSPSRKDGIDLIKESKLRMFYCSFLKDIGFRLGLHGLYACMHKTIYYDHKLPLPQQLYIAIASISTNPMSKMIGRFVFSSQFLCVASTQNMMFV
ncbi:hypothetical protein ZIOFF_058349 [Zingiber officinale]|uniref:Uncharacterized protein n=1 Tax=Zingiber officinale TaxID=94328 RepID=A0A8J5FB56_ZINOF|nr:hypothetical protein ZIOFF_058349 [Zingiber officinale]